MELGLWSISNKNILTRDMYSKMVSKINNKDIMLEVYKSEIYLCNMLYNNSKFNSHK